MKILRLLPIIVVAFTLFSQQALACTPDWCMLHGHLQRAVALGKINTITQESLELEVTKTWFGKSLPRTIQVYNLPNGATIGSDSWNDLKTGDYLLTSIKENEGHYYIGWLAYRVSSLDFSTLTLVPPPKFAEEAYVQWWVNHDGNTPEGMFIDNEAYVQNSDGTCIQLFPTDKILKPAGQMQPYGPSCNSIVLVRDTKNITYPVRGTTSEKSLPLRRVAFTLGAAVAVGIVYMVMKKYKRA